MTIGRRDLMLGGIGAGLAAAAGPRAAATREEPEMPGPFSTYGIVPGGGIDQTASLQEAADRAAQSGKPFFLPPGDYTTAKLALKSGTEIQGVPGKSVLRYNGGGALISIEDAVGIRLTGLTLEGEAKPIDGGALLVAEGVKGLTLSDCRIVGSAQDGVVLRKVSGRITDCEIGDIRGGGLFSEDAGGLEIGHNHVRDCGDNAILVWRSAVGEDGTIVTANRIERITAKSGGSGQNGNGVNVFRAGSVMVSNNRITDCAFSAIRSNSGSNCQMIGNSCARLGEVALYAEFAFEGAVISNNIVDDAAMGISVTNFNEGGRLAVVQGNLIRNIFFRKDADSRGVGIAVEADSVVSGNVIEAAPGYGIMIGWGRYLRDVSVTGNLIRNAHIGIGVSTDILAGTALITDNLITGAKDGAIRAMNGPTPTGPDLATASAEAYRNLVVSSNVAR
ncbi:MAG: TIGR03808 family TAT-translocated repetitive protein [Methyloceanibacter sp.]